MTNQTPEEPLERLMREAGLTREAYIRLQDAIQASQGGPCGCNSCSCGLGDEDDD